MRPSNDRSSEGKRVRPHPKLENVEFPESSEAEVIIPCRPTFYGYCLLRQREDLLKDVSNAEINDTVAKINKMVDLHLIEKKIEENKEFELPLAWLFRAAAATAAGLAFLTFILTAAEVSGFRETFIFVPLSLILVLVVFCLALLIKGLVTVKAEKNYDALISKAIDRLLKKENQMHYNAKGYLMDKNENLYWLSLRKVF